jgi:hypothetical protein
LALRYESGARLLAKNQQFSSAAQQIDLQLIDCLGSVIAGDLTSGDIAIAHVTNSARLNCHNRYA